MPAARLPSTSLLTELEQGVARVRAEKDKLEEDISTLLRVISQALTNTRK